MTWLNDLKNNVVEAGSGNTLVPATRTASANGTGVDLQASDGPCFALVQAGTVSGTSPTLDAKVQESDDNSTFTDITGATFTQITASNKSQIITFKRAKRYCRLVFTIAGTSPSFASAGFIGGQKKAF